MNILSIETSCDETAVSIVEAVGDFPHATYRVLSHALFSQIDIHREYGGVFPMMAKREHAATLVPMLEKAYRDAKLDSEYHPEPFPEQIIQIKNMLDREPGLADQLLTFHQEHGKPPIDVISVTNGPGLEPTLWVGISFAKALALLWNVPVVPANHMEGHVLASVFDGTHLAALRFPALALLVSGGHTELILMRDWLAYEKIGGTRDDAVGEAFDKVARLMGLPYPGGPEIDRLAKQAREQHLTSDIGLPRPMLDSTNYEFSFSGLKTAVRYALEKMNATDEDKMALAREFQAAVTEVLIKKTSQAIDAFSIQSAILGGGVSANEYLRESFKALSAAQNYPDLDVYVPERHLSTDNAVMIALVGHARFHDALAPKEAIETIKAEGRRSLSVATP